MEIVKSRPSIFLAEFANTYIPFGILIIIALLGAELTPNFTLYRANYSFLASTVLLIPSLCLYILSPESLTKHNYWLLLWTFAWLAYLVYGFYQYLAIANNIPETSATSGSVMIVIQVLGACWWTVDLALAWLSNAQAPWMRVQRLGSSIYIGLSFLTISLLQPGQLSLWLAIILAVAIVSSFLIGAKNNE